MRLCVLLVFVVLAPILGAQPTVRFDRENMRLRSATVTAQGSAFNLLLVMGNDNGTADGVLPSSYRRWWHCEIGGLRTSGETLNVTIDRAGYTDVILPVWALSTDGVTFGAYQRAPTSATPTVAGSQHRFTLQTPVGVRALRLAKFFPYTVTQNDAWLQSLTGRPGIRGRATLGLSRQGRPIQMLELTDRSVPDTLKHRVWVHTAVHPAETTANFVAEGLVEFLLSGDPLAALILDHLIVDVVAMANPDGAFLGNYRTNADSVNLEEQWARPYASTVPEIVALRSRIEALMGTVAAPASNPIEIVLNLHSSHGVSYPFHFQHTANPGFDLNGSNSGVLPIVNQLEAHWYGARAFLVDGLIHDCGAIVKEGAARGLWFDMSTMKEPYRLEGKKTMGLELVEQLGWRLPDAIFYPTGGGTGLIGMHKAFLELRELGWLAAAAPLPRLFACQAAGCAPIVEAFTRGLDRSPPIANPHTDASGLRVPRAFADFMILDAVRQTRGGALAAAEATLRPWMRMTMATEGIALCPEAAACLEGLQQARRSGQIGSDAEVVVFNTGTANKYIEVLQTELPRLQRAAVDWSLLAGAR